MSADRWVVCPKCSVTIEKEIEDLELELKESYGKIPLVEWKALERKISTLDSTANEPEETVPCYEEIYLADDGKFTVSFHASCTKCDFNFQYDHEEQVDIGGA